MTIALAMFAEDGLVMAADRQETIPGFWKNDVRKLSSISVSAPAKWRSCLITGAGHGHYIDALTDSFRDVITGDLDATPEQTIAGLTDVLRDFQEKSVIPYAAFQDRPDVHMMVAFTCKGGNNDPGIRLITSEHSVFVENQEYVAVGSGAMLAKTVMARFFPGSPFLDVRMAVLLTAFVMAQVKDSIDGCGKRTDIDGFRNGHPFWIDPEHIETLEGAVRAYMEVSEPINLWAIVKQPHTANSTSLKKRLKDVREALKRVTL